MPNLSPILDLPIDLFDLVFENCPQHDIIDTQYIDLYFAPQRYNNFNSPVKGDNRRSGTHTLTDIGGLTDQLQSRSVGVTQLLYDLS